MRLTPGQRWEIFYMYGVNLDTVNEKKRAEVLLEYRQDVKRWRNMDAQERSNTMMAHAVNRCKTS